MRQTRVRLLSAVVVGFLAWLALPGVAQAGHLVFTNLSDKPITCQVDGYPTPVVIPPAVTIQRYPNMAAAEPRIDFVQCGTLRTRMMGITPTGPNRILIFNGQQTRTLNVLLYPYIPTLNGDFTALVTYIVNTYQAQNPQVLLNAVMDASINTYDFPTLQKMAGPGGYDVLEVDMSFLGFLVTNNLITPVAIAGDPPWPVARQTATWKGTLYGIPSWLCTDFLYAFSNDPNKRLTFKDLKALQPADPRVLVTDFDGSWELPAMYLNTYIQTYGYPSIQDAFTKPIDSAVIQALTEYINACNGPDGNPCIDGRFHNAPDGTVEKVFATGGAQMALGFSERSFFINLYQTAPGHLSTIPMIWNWPYMATVLMYTDALVTNRSTCSTGSCPGDSQAFTTLLTSAAMKTYIAFSKDLPAGTPARRLLVATQPFWSQPIVQNDALYQLFSVVLSNGNPYTAQPFPNWFTQANKDTMSGGVCDALKSLYPNYACAGTTKGTGQAKSQP